MNTSVTTSGPVSRTADQRRLAIVGGGQMGRALAGGMLAQGVISTSHLCVVEPTSDGRAWWSEHLKNVAVVETLEQGIQSADAALLAVKPGVIPKVAQQKSGFWAGKLVVSIAAGVNLTKLAGWIGHKRLIRVMPNTPSLVGEGASAYCCASDVTATDESWIETVLSSVGMAVRVEETQMDAVTGLSGSGPAYVCLMIEALADGGVLAGLPRALAQKLATQTVLGTAAMVAQTGRHPGELKDAVASPGGTTIAGLRVLEQNGVRGALINAVAAAANRSRELDLA
jgi:pyrroline-5-carboxylate reductase